MYLLLPKDPCDVGTPVAPEEQNIVDMPAMEFSLFFPSLGVFSWLFLYTLGFF